MRILTPLFGLTIALTAGLAAAEEPPRLLTMEGVGYASGPPDLATIRIGVETRAEEAEEALAENSGAAGKLIAEAKARGVAPRDIQTSNLSIYPIYADRGRTTPQEAPKLVGYAVSNEVVLRIRDLAEMGATLGGLVSAGANQMRGISFEIDDAAALLDDARRAAVADARRKAEVFAAAAGVDLGRIISISEGGGGGPAPYAAELRSFADSAAVPVEAGETTVSARVRIVWSIGG
ncbi:MAG: SIMPL domain-containing protein [Pseudomonadota bacterium]